MSEPDREIPSQYKGVWDECVLDMRDAAERLKPILVELGDSAEIVFEDVVIVVHNKDQQKGSDAMSKKRKRFSCKNRLNKEGKHELYRRDLDQGCTHCRYFESHRGASWLDDWARCMAPAGTRYGKQYEIVPAREERLVAI